jgi:hypothetical protein
MTPQELRSMALANQPEKPPPKNVFPQVPCGLLRHRFARETDWASEAHLYDISLSRFDMAPNELCQFAFKFYAAMRRVKIPVYARRCYWPTEPIFDKSCAVEFVPCVHSDAWSRDLAAYMGLTGLQVASQNALPIIYLRAGIFAHRDHAKQPRSFPDRKHRVIPLTSKKLLQKGIKLDS